MKAADIDLAKLAHARGWISEDRLNRSLSEADRYQALGLDKPVDEILIEQGCLTSEQVKSLRDALGLTLRHPRIGDYEIVRRVGVGGMGTVFEACHIRLKQRIALKILLPRLSKDPQATERFLREARTLARLNHPHLVHAIDAGQDGERYYLAMEYIEGENLLQVLMREGPLPPERTCEIARDVCEALGALEAKGLVHRDVKPANILIGLDGKVKLADFGLLAPADESGGPAAGPVCGTPHYISPEQASRKGEVDVRSDLYSLAASWYHILTGQPPFMGKSTKEIVQGHLHKDPAPPSRVRSEVPPALDRLLLRWLSKEKEARPKSAKEALAEIDQLTAALQTRGKRARWLQPRWAIPGALAALLAAAVLLLVVTRRGGEETARAPESVAAAPERAPEPEHERVAPGGDEPTPSAAQASAATTEAAVPARAPASDGTPKTFDSGVTAGSSKVLPPPLPLPEPRAHEERPFLASLIARIRKRYASTSAVAASAFTALETRAAPAVERFRPLARLARTFHASFTALEPERDPPAGIVLRYELRRGSEIDDFRSKPGAWAVRGGALVALAEPQGEPLETVAWFMRPVTIAGEIAEAGPLIVGLDDLRVALGSGTDSRVWREDSAAPVAILAAPSARAGRWAVTFREGSIEMFVGGKTFRIDEPSPVGTGPAARGARLVLKLAPGRSITRLEIDGGLEPAWARERARLAQEVR